MTLETVRDTLAWCSVINIGVLLWWFVFFALARDWIYSYHSRWFDLPMERFTAIHYSGMMAYKLGMFLFNIVPYLALRIVY
jgi:hypothetical protein